LFGTSFDSERESLPEEAALALMKEGFFTPNLPAAVAWFGLLPFA
jgi:hypothetical protein